MRRGALLCNRHNALEHWDLRRLDSRLSEGPGGGACIRAALGGERFRLFCMCEMVRGLGNMGPLALSGTADGLINLVSLNGGLKICKTLPGHSEEVLFMDVKWGDSTTRALLLFRHVSAMIL